MKNKTKLGVLMILSIIILLLSGYSKKPNDVLNYLKTIKVGNVKYCKFQANMPNYTVNKKLDNKDIKKFINLLNKSKSATNGKFPLSKGGYIGLNLYMKSGKIISFNNLNGGFWIDYGNKRYKIAQPDYENFFISMKKKYSK